MTDKCRHAGRWRAAIICLGVVVAGAIAWRASPWPHRRPYISYETMETGASEVPSVVYHFAPTHDRHGPSGFYVPRDVEDAIRELDKMLPREVIEKMQAGSAVNMINYHMSIGLWLRNNWGLWQGSRLKDYFNSMGIFHPDDMSGIILDSYWRHLHGKPLQVRQQAMKYREFWQIFGITEDGGAAISGTDTAQESAGAANVMTCRVSGESEGELPSHSGVRGGVARRMKPESRWEARLGESILHSEWDDLLEALRWPTNIVRLTTDDFRRVDQCP